MTHYIKQKHIDAIKKMIDSNWAWDIGNYRYRLRYSSPPLRTIVLVIQDTSSGLEELEFLMLDSPINETQLEALRVGWYELYTPIEVKDANRRNPNFKRNPLHDKKIKF